MRSPHEKTVMAAKEFLERSRLCGRFVGGSIPRIPEALPRKVKRASPVIRANAGKEQNAGGPRVAAGFGRKSDGNYPRC
jgi:hypothetical protein